MSATPRAAIPARAFLVRNGNGFDLIGVDSNFRSQSRCGPFIYIAVSAASFATRSRLTLLLGRHGHALSAARQAHEALRLGP